MTADAPRATPPRREVTPAKPLILVVGATGTVGTLVVEKLLEGGQRVRALVRDPAAAATRLGPAVELVQGDLMDPASLASALRGVDAASLATAPGPHLPEQEASFIEAARAARLPRLVKLSAFGAPRAPDPISTWHRQSEQHLRASGIPATVLRPVIFMSNLRLEAVRIQRGELPSVFGDGRMSFVDPRDVAELTVRALIDPAHQGMDWELGGPEALSYDDLAAAFTRALGHRVEHVRLDAAGFRDTATRAGLPEFVVESLQVTAALAQRGAFAAGDDVIQRVLGRPGYSFSSWLALHRNAFTP